MAYEKLLNEIYAVLSLKYLWKGYQPSFIKSESPDWINLTMDLGLEVSQALLPDDGQTKKFIEQYLGCLQSEIPSAASDRFGNRLHFYNGRFWAVLPEHEKKEDYIYKANYRFDCKLKKLNSNFQKFGHNGLYLYLHPQNHADIQIDPIFSHMKEQQKQEHVRFDWVFLNCRDRIYVLDFRSETYNLIPLPENSYTFLNEEAERLRHSRIWSIGAEI